MHASSLCANGTRASLAPNEKEIGEICCDSRCQLCARPGCASSSRTATFGLIESFQRCCLDQQSLFDFRRKAGRPLACQDPSDTTCAILPLHHGARVAANVEPPPRENVTSISLLIPGMSNHAPRAAVIDANLRLLAQQSHVRVVQCQIFVYKTVRELPDTLLSGLVPSRGQCGCEFTRQLGFWIRHVRAHTVNATARFVLLLMDSVALRPSVDLHALAAIANVNDLGLASPACRNCPSKPLLRPDSAYNSSSRCGRLVEYADPQVWLMTLPAWRCWHRLIDVIGLETDPMGWSFARTLQPYCRLRVGIVDTMLVDKRFTSSKYPDKTQVYENASRPRLSISYVWKDAYISAAAGQAKLRRLEPTIPKVNNTRVHGPLRCPK